MTVPPTISLGSTDTASVVAAQRDLNVADAREQAAGRAGLSTCPLTEDGNFDSNTRQATIEFQSLRSLKIDGIIGPKTWEQLEAVVNPASGVASSTALPLEGVARWSVSMSDIGVELGELPSPAQLVGVTVAVGDTPAATPPPAPSHDGSLIFFTPPAGDEGPADLVVTGSDGSTFVLPNAVRYTASMAAGLEGVVVSLAISVQEAAMRAKAQEVGRLQAFVTDVAAAMDAYQDLLGLMLDRLQDPSGTASAEDEAAWLAHIATRARMVADIVNEQCRITLATDAIADLDGMPFGGGDDEPTLDTGALALLMTALENVIVPSVVDLTA